MNVVERIEAYYSDFTRTQERIADYVLTNSDKACFLSLKEFSAEVSASEVTIIKFTRLIGYKNFTHFKNELQKYISDRLSPSEKIASAISHLSEVDFDYFVQQDRDTINSMLSLLDVEMLESAIALLKNGRKIYTVGDNISKIISDFIGLRLRNLGLPVAEFDLRSFEGMAYQLRGVNNQDVFIITSFPKYARTIIPLTEYLHCNEIPMICITDRVASPVARYATVTFPCPTESSVFYNSITAPITLANILVSSLAVELRDAYRENRQEINKTAEFLREKNKNALY